jgi:TfoX/Sxy family transcriptional regulator of competence genes
MKPEIERLSAIARDAAPPDLELASRPLFGGLMFYAGGRPFALVWRGGLALKLTEPDRTEFLAMPGAAPWQYAAQRSPSKSYAAVPDAMLGDREALRSWMARAAATATPVSRQRRTRII